MLVAKQSYTTVELIHSTVYDDSKTYYLNRRYASKTATGSLTIFDTDLLLSFNDTLADGWWYFEVHELTNSAGESEVSGEYYYNTLTSSIYQWDGSTQTEVESLDARTPEEILNYIVTSDAINVLSDKVVTQANLSKCLDDCDFLLKMDTIEALKREEGFNAANDLVITIE